MLRPSLEPNETQKLLIKRQYGMFIHFGINTFNDTEWSDGTLPVSSYAPTQIDAENWVRNAYMAGMKYVILITKHHDGFCLWDTATTDYCVNNSPNKTDVVKAVADACEKYGIELGLYYSLWDRHEKCYKDDKAYVKYMLGHLEELTDGRYGKICEVWFDGAWDKKSECWGLDELYALIKKNQPNCAVGVNTTIGKYNKKGSPSKWYYPEHYRKNMPMHYFPSDFRLFDPHITKKNDPKIYKHKGQQYYLPFETTLCIRNMRNWFWDPKYLEDKLISVDFIVSSYNHLIGQQNNMIINVAPNTDGRQEDADMVPILEAAKRLGIYRDAPIF